MDLNLKYAGEAVFFLGVAYRLLRWVAGAFLEGDLPPSAFPVAPTMRAGQGLAGTAEQVAHTLMAQPRGEAGVPTAWARTGNLEAPPLPGDPALFPPEMLAAMTPEQRAHVMDSLAKQRTSVAPPTPVDPALFPSEMLGAMTPEQRAHVMDTLAKQRANANTPLPNDPALFPPEMLAAMTPEQRANVMEILAKQRMSRGH